MGLTPELAPEEKEVAEEITDFLYDVFASDSGYLFGISPEWRPSVEIIVGLTVQHLWVYKEGIAGED